ncbi:MAG: T9SS type A sorting domain-containing protein [Bacteroidetes bacterium]|nr:T9SS type A sorting domain-containing protein [Bacteroidota bacterium]
MLIIEFANPRFSFAQWTNNTSINTPVCTSINNQKDYSLAPDTKGGAFIIWNDKRNNIEKSDIYAQRINSLGYTLWTSQGIGVCTNSADQVNPSTTEDGYGGVIIAWDDSINGDRDIYAQKLDSLGNPQWTVDGVPVVIKPLKQKNVKIISDGAGGAIAVWEDSLASYWDIYAQRINSAGIQQWTSSGVSVCKSMLNQKNPRLVSDGLGGAYIVWQDKRSNIDYDIYAQHLNASGIPLWTINGVVICNSGDKQTDPKIVSDGTGGAIIAWQDERGGGISYNIYAQRINSTGTIQWPSNGAVVCAADSSQTNLDITSDSISGAIITWRDKRNGAFHDIYAQKINLDGTVAWQLNGIPITVAALTQTSPNICGDGVGGAIITWQDSIGTSWDIKSQRINSNGNIMWNYNGTFVSNSSNSQTNPKNISDGKGGSIYVWQDFRNGLDDDIYAQHLDMNGVEGIFNETFYLNNLNIFPNPVSESAIISWSDKNTNTISWTGIVYDGSGKEIYSFNLGKSDNKLNVKSLSNGLYFLKIINNEKKSSLCKFIVEK